jgi:thioredoxin-like negative regulator of GroEL
MDFKILYLPDEIEETINSQPAALFYFSAPHCNVCKVLKPKIAEMVKEKFPKILLYYIDLEKSPAISGQYRIFTIPTILVYMDGKEYIRKSRNLGINELSDELSRPYSLMFDD